jgi:hypothetical protein
MPMSWNARGTYAPSAGREQPAGARGWKAYLTVDDEVEVFCPECVEREFGD